IDYRQCYSSDSKRKHMKLKSPTGRLLTKMQLSLLEIYFTQNDIEQSKEHYCWS
ncbi:hypothetical protein L9F63_014102, partial [Diploptera punctata]